MGIGSTLTETRLIGNLNDLLQLDLDAVSAYALAIRELDSATRKAVLRRYQSDHKRHVAALKRLIRAHGGAPLAVSHLPTGPFKLGMQALAAAGDDRAVLLAFKTNERQVRDKYRRAASKRGLPADVARVLKRGARDEERHYRWVEKSLRELRVGPGTVLGRVAGVVEVGNARAVDVIEAAGKPVMTAFEATRRGVRAAARQPMRAAAVAAVASGAAAAVALTRRGR